MTRTGVSREIRLGRNSVIRPTEVFDTYWRFAVARQNLFYSRLAGGESPWTTDPILAAHRFTNVFRASDRVSQYLIQRVIYDAPHPPEDLVFRILLFKMFNRIETWEGLEAAVGHVSWRTYDYQKYARVLDRMHERHAIYSGAYIMPSPPFGHERKHRNHLALLDHMMRSSLSGHLAKCRSLGSVYETLLSYPSIGPFLAFQLAIDLNYSELTDFSELSFVVAGPGALSGISKCFHAGSDALPADVIRWVADASESECERLGLACPTLWGRPLQLIDCQNVFCEVDKYARVAHPQVSGVSGRTRIKQRYNPNSNPQPQWYPPKWGISGIPRPAQGLRKNEQLNLLAAM